jgi:hypothetical protein
VASAGTAGIAASVAAAGVESLWHSLRVIIHM